MGHRLTQIEPPQGFAAESAGASILLAASYYGFPLSTTQVVSGAVVGSGIGKRLASVHWDVFGRIAGAWALTLPAAGLVAFGAWQLSDLLGDNGGPVVLAILAACGCGALYVLARRDPVTAADV
jgi:PiT family inorganic phosphate transporter